VKEAAEKRGWKVVMNQVVPYGTREWGPILTQIKSLNPAMIYYEDVSPPDAITFFRQFMKAPTNSLINFGFSIIPSGFMETMGKEADGLMGFEMTAVYLPVAPTPEANAWLKEFTEKMKLAPRHPSSASYVGIMIWAEAVKAVGDPKNYRAINEYIANHSFKTFLGNSVKFSEDHIITNESWPLSNIQIQNGVRTTIYTKPGVKYLDYKFQTPPWIKK
jgi:branched-chain amino acid transport system substrate-binding protein